MMVIGMPGFSDAQNRVHMSLWAMSGAPLLVGADLTKLTPETLAMLTKKAVVAVDQDALGLQAVKVAEPQKGVQVWSKPLAGPGRHAVLLLNRTVAAASVAVAWKDIGVADFKSATVKDLWSGKDVGDFIGSFSAEVPAGDAVFLLVRGWELPFPEYKPKPDDQGPCRGCELRFANVAASNPWALVRITYRNPSDASQYADLRVNDQDSTAVAFPPTGVQAGQISVMVRLDRPGATNVLTFSAGGNLTAMIDAINVE